MVDAGFPDDVRDAQRDTNAFADLVYGVLKLPLTDAEKAEAVRRLLTEK